MKRRRMNARGTHTDKLLFDVDIQEYRILIDNLSHKPQAIEKKNGEEMACAPESWENGEMSASDLIGLQVYIAISTVNRILRRIDNDNDLS